MVQCNMEQSSAIATKAVKKAEKDAKEAVEQVNIEFTSKRKCVELEQQTRCQHATATALMTPTFSHHTTIKQYKLW